MLNKLWQVPKTAGHSSSSIVLTEEEFWESVLTMGLVYLSKIATLQITCHSNNDVTVSWPLAEVPSAAGQ